MHYFSYLLNKLLEFYLDAVVNTLSIFQPNSEQLEKQVEKRKVALEEARLKAKGLNPSVTPALAAFGGFSPASKPCKFVFCFAFSYAGYTLHDFQRFSCPLHDCLMCAHYTTDRQQGVTHYTTFQSEESQITLSGIQNMFNNQTRKKRSATANKVKSHARNYIFVKMMHARSLRLKLSVW